MSESRLLYLVRPEPGLDEVTARSGVVADAVIFPDGAAILRWRGGFSTEFYESESDMRRIRERSGRSHFVELR